MRIVRSGVVAAAPYARFVAALPNVRSVAVSSPSMAIALRETGVVERLTRIELARSADVMTILELCGHADALDEIVVGAAPSIPQLQALRANFPALRRLVIGERVPQAYRAAVDRLFPG